LRLAPEAAAPPDAEGVEAGPDFVVAAAAAAARETGGM